MSQKKKIKKKKSIFPQILGVCFLMISIFIAISVGKDIFEMFSLQNQQKEINEELKRLEEENASLVATKEKLEDPNYVSTYARGEYMFSKGDEKLFRLPSSGE